VVASEKDLNPSMVTSSKNMARCTLSSYFLFRYRLRISSISSS
jgi:hypothetical protein